jgi:SAM-dependent methyltransferase
LRPNYLEQAEDPRDRVVLDLVRRAGAKDVFDVGCNDGLHAVIFAAAGYDVLGVDTDAYAIDKFYGWLRKRPEFNVAVSIDNFKTLAHKASTVVSLALTHHLALTAKMPFDEIARRYAEMSRESLIVEFMPNGLGSTVRRPDPLPDDYRLEVFLDALKQHFGHVEVVDYARPEGKALRTLIYCSGRRTA